MDDVRRLGSSGADSQDDGGVLQSWIDGSLDTAQTVFSGCATILDQSRTQLHERVSQTIDWAEGFPRGLFAVARQVNSGIDAVAAQSIAAGDRVGRSVLSALRRAGHGARSVASEATASFVGNGVQSSSRSQHISATTS
jgi:hypothetical protein